MITLKNNTQTHDPRLDRIVQFDEKSRQYPIRELLRGIKTPRSYTWSCGQWLDQGNEGACVGFAWAHDLNARPKVVPADYLKARHIYLEAQKIDEWPGEDYGGTSVLAGAKVVANLGYMPEYRWCFGLDDLILAVGYAGPAVLGINWYTNMSNTNSLGFIRVGGSVAGGHAILCRGVNIRGRYFTLRNSWGKDWGTYGDCKISFDDMGRLLAEQGEACIPVLRNL